MKSTVKCLIAIFIVAFVRMVEVANAFYDPGLQRWINRDPLGDIASLPLITTVIAPGVQAEGNGGMNSDDFFDAWVDVNRNSYGAMRNNLVSVSDPLGLSPTLNPANQTAAAECMETAAQAGARKLAQEAAQKEALKQAAKKAAQDQAAKKAAEKAAEKMAKDMAKKIEKDLGKEARRAFHDSKHLTDRTADELRRDAMSIYEQYGGSCPSWMRL